MKQFGANIKERFFGRHLLSFDEGVEKICKRGSEELNNYYITRVDETIGLDEEDEDEKDNEKTPEYIDALIDIVKGTTGKSDKEMSDNLMTYGQHLIGVFICLAIAILAIPGWLICCSCCCCNCCCCCCCKKPTCKFPFFIVTLALYVLVAGICVYGLIKSNSIFRGLSDTECSILQFFNETIEGEAKAENPKWAGIEGIKSILTKVKDRINTEGSSTYAALQQGQTDSIDLRDEFAQTLETKSGEVTDVNENRVELDGKQYRLDITMATFYGSFEHTHQTGDGYVKNWYEEYKIIADESDRNLQTAADNFYEIINGGSVTGYLDEIKDSVDEMGKSVKEVKDSMADSIVEYSDYIDEYGKLGFKIFFSALVVIDAAIAALIFLLCFCSGEKCKNCCLFRCGFKLLIHLFWNILALLMIITLFIGFIFTLIGSIGKDLTFVVNYFISEENMNQAEPALFGAEGKKLSTCFNGEGDILKELSKDGTIDLTKMNSFDNLNDLIDDIKSAERQFENLKTQCNAYNYMMNEYNRRVNYQGSFSIIQVDPVVATPDTRECSGVITSTNALGQACRDLVDLAKETSDTSKSFYSGTEAIKSDFDGFLNTQITTLQTFRSNIKSLTGIFDDYIGENGGIFGFVNCKFIGSNIKVILKNLRKGVGNSFYSIGICFVLAGCSLALSISFTILLVVIINLSVDSAKNKPMS